MSDGVEISKKLVIYLIFNLGMAALVYLGVYKDIDGAYYLLASYMWIITIISMIMCSPEIIRHIRNEGMKLSMNNTVDVIFDISLMSVLIWFGAGFLAFLYFVHFCCVQYIKVAVTREIEEKQETDGDLN